MPEASIPDLLQIAQVQKPYGADGGLLVSFRDVAPEDIGTEEPVFIYFDGLPVPFFIESLSARGASRAWMHLTGVDSLSDAEEIAGRGLFIEASRVMPADGEGWEDFSGWTLRDADGTPAGTVSGLEDIPGNPCLVVETPSGQVLVPLHEELVLHIDEDRRELTMEIPAGLL